MCSPFIFAQTVSINSIYVNSVYSQSINLGSNSSSNVTLSVLVTLPAAQSNSNPGTINVYYKRNTSASAIVGGYGGSLLFNGGTNATRSFSVNLSASEFDTSGGILYAEYKTFSGIIYKSGNISIIKNVDTGGTPVIPGNVPDVTKISNTLCCNQTVRLGDKPASITGSDYANPYPDHSTYGIGSSWTVNGNAGVSILNSDNKIYNLDYIKDLSTFTVTRGLKYNNKFSSANNSNPVTITVVPSPILSNEIYINKTDSNTDNFIEIIDTNPKSISGGRSDSSVNLNILQNPFHTPQRGDNFSNVEKYEWEYAKTNAWSGGYKYWTTIVGENSSSLDFFNPLDKSSNEDNYYLVRRIAIYQNIKRVSNTLKILLRTTRNNNNICCDQKLDILSSGVIESPNAINGSVALMDNTTINGTNLTYTVSYQWQSQSITNDRVYSNWSDIIDAKSKDYQPLPLKFVTTPRGTPIIQTTYNYRRLAKINYQVYDTNWHFGTMSSYSNEVNLSPSNPDSEYPSQTLTLYPNPASSIINIEYKGVDYILANTKISIVNTTGILINLNNFSIINPNLISIDISNLAIGTYFLNIETSTNRGSRLTFIKK